MRIFSLVFCLVLIYFSTNAQSLSGKWEGLLVAGQQKLKLVFHIMADTTQKLHAAFDSPDQGAFGIPCTETNQKGDSIEMLIKTINGGYRGKWDRKNIINGYYFQNGMQFPLDLTLGSPAKRPQTPRPPFPYHSEDIEYTNLASDIHYGATITYPNSGGPFPAVLLITGSGLQDRDETIFDHKPFAVIADYLTRRGFAVLRVDDRQKGKSTGDIQKATTQDFVKDIETSLLELQKRNDIDQKKIGLIGHSEGGLIACMVAAENTSIDFIILLAGPGLKGDKLLELQRNAISMSDGPTAKGSQDADQLSNLLIQAVMSSKDTSIQMDHAWKSFVIWRKTANPALLKDKNLDNDSIAKNFIRSELGLLENPWLLFFLRTDPADYIVQLHCKVLALNGSKDIQVVADPNLSAIDSALKKSKVKIYSTQKIPGLNHLFQHCKTCKIEEYGELEETFAPDVLQIMGDWLDKNVK